MILPPRDGGGIVDRLLPPRPTFTMPLEGALQPRERVEPGARSHVVEVEREVLSHAVVIPLQDLWLFLPFGTDRSILVYPLVVCVRFGAFHAPAVEKFARDPARRVTSPSRACRSTCRWR